MTRRRATARRSFIRSDDDGASVASPDWRRTHEPMPPLDHQAAIAMRHDRLADSVLGMLLIAACSSAA